MAAHGGGGQEKGSDKKRGPRQQLLISPCCCIEMNQFLYIRASCVAPSARREFLNGNLI